MKKAPIKNEEIPIEYELIDIARVQKLLGLKSDDPIYKLMKDGSLPYRKIGATRKFTWDDIGYLIKNSRICKKLS